MSKIEGFGQKFEQILEENKSNRRFMDNLKNLLVKEQSYALASDVRSIELDNVPAVNTSNPDYTKALQISKAIELVGLKASASTCYKFMKVIEKFNELGMEFSIKDSSKIQCDHQKVYGDEE